MTRQSLLDLADVLSERKGKTLGLSALFSRRLQKLCGEYRFWWRKRYATFNLVPGTNTYQLVSGLAGLAPSTAFTEIGPEEIVMFFRPDKSVSPPGILELDPVLDGAGFVSMLNNTIPAPPSRYIMDYSDFKTIRVDPVDATYSVTLMFWAMPDVAQDSASDVVPLVPPWYHQVIIDGMIYDIFAKSYGEQNGKTVIAKNDYDNGVQNMIMRPQYTSKAASSLIVNESSTRSTARSFGDETTDSSRNN